MKEHSLPDRTHEEEAAYQRHLVQKREYDRVETLRNAAPDMLAALKGMQAEWEKITRYGSPMARAGNEAVQAMDAAISKAEGRS